MRRQKSERIKAVTTVSIHAPREGCDRWCLYASRSLRCFNSRTPGGVRLDLTSRVQREFVFQFTHPGRGATTHSQHLQDRQEFQFTHPGRGATPNCQDDHYTNHSFNSRTPGGVRPLLGGVLGYLGQFQFTHPGRGATQNELNYKLFQEQFQFTHPGRGATRMERRSLVTLGWFQFTHPGRGATGVAQIRGSHNLSFNSRTPGGVRPSWTCRKDDAYCFNSRTPGGVRLGVGCSLTAISSFNSRTPGGVRQCGAKLRIMGRINKRNLRLAVLL